MRTTTLLAAVCAILGLGAQTNLAAPPNIVFILADDLGYGDLSCYGQQHFSTPHLDRMAAEGLRFTAHYAGSTVCAPSRACLHTGLHTGHGYQRFNGKIELRQDPHDTIVARLLQTAGYRTALIGKSGLSCLSDNGRHPNDKGFEHFFGYISHRAAHRYYPEFLWRNGAKVLYPDNQGKEGAQYSGELFLTEALAFLDAQEQGQPFYLHLSLQQPHADLAAPDAWKEKFIGKFDEQPYQGGHYRAEPHPKATFAAMVAYLDHSVGQVLEKLRQQGLAEETLVLFSSDNGPMSEGGWHRNNFDSDGPLRGGKRDLYEGGIRVPTIAWWPGTIEPHRVTDHPSAFWDFMPTVCELAAIDPPAGIDGISYLPTLLGKPQPKHDYLYWEFYERGGKQAVRQGDWKGVRLNVRKDRNGPLEVYNLATDLAESNDVRAEHPEVAQRLAEIMAEAHVPSAEISF